jgi:urease accessory protein
LNSSSALQVLLHLSDSALPIGRLAHSFGLEPLVMSALIDGEEAVHDYLVSKLRDCIAPLDGVAVSWSHRYLCQGDLPAIHTLNELVTCRKPVPSMRAASENCGRELLRLLADIPISPDFALFSDQVRLKKCGVNLSVVIGSASAAAGIGLRDCVVMEMRSAASGLLSAAVRLGTLSASNAQSMLWQLGGSIEEAADIALSLEPETMAGWLPDADAYYLKHKQLLGRNFGS